MVRRLGGEPVCAPALSEHGQPDPAADEITRLVSGGYGLAVFLTGAGATALLADADRLGKRDDAVRALQAMSIACRGPKPLAVLKRHGIGVAVTTERPHTSRDLLTALETQAFDRATALLVHYGERNAEFAAALGTRVARLDEVCPYVWRLPDDPQPIASLVVDALNGRLDAIVFTSQIQCRHLFQVAGEMRLATELAAALTRDVVVGVIGPVCAEVVQQHGVTPDVMPAAPNMAALITAVGDYFELTNRSDVS